MKGLAGAPGGPWVRVGNVIQILFSSSLEAGYLYRELAEGYKRAEGKLEGGEG